MLTKSHIKSLVSGSGFPEIVFINEFCFALRTKKRDGLSLCQILWAEEKIWLTPYEFWEKSQGRYLFQAIYHQVPLSVESYLRPSKTDSKKQIPPTYNIFLQVQAETSDESWPPILQNATDCMKNSEEIAVKLIPINECMKHSPYNAVWNLCPFLYVYAEIQVLYLNTQEWETLKCQQSL